jgi:hypothetical protein
MLKKPIIDPITFENQRSAKRGIFTVGPAKDGLPVGRVPEAEKSGDEAYPGANNQTGVEQFG